jgi:hypothetical protein
MDVSFQDGEVVISASKYVLVMRRERFIEALRRGKAYRRRQALQARQDAQAAMRRGFANALEARQAREQPQERR